MIHIWANAGTATAKAGLRATAGNSVLCEPTHWVTRFLVDSFSGGICTQWLLSQWKHSSPTYPVLQIRNVSGGFYSDSWGADRTPDRTKTATEQRGGPVQHPVKALVTITLITTPYQGNNSLHTQRKDMAGIHTKNSSYKKKIRGAQTTQGHSHTKTAL